MTMLSMSRPGGCRKYGVKRGWIRDGGHWLSASRGARGRRERRGGGGEEIFCPSRVTGAGRCRSAWNRLKSRPGVSRGVSAGRLLNENQLREWESFAVALFPLRVSRIGSIRRLDAAESASLEAILRGKHFPFPDNLRRLPCRGLSERAGFPFWAIRAIRTDRVG